jgi:cytochrome c553
MAAAQQGASSAAPGSTARPAQPAATAADAALGGRIAAQGVPDKGVAACASCHGQRGEGMAASAFPRLAGQSAAYLAHQIESFANDTRANPIMSPIAKAMTREQNLATAAYYASLNAGTSASAQNQAPSAAGKADTGRGQRLASAGDDAAQVQACANCHGPGGTGEAPAYPYLAGQHASYLANALNEWKTGSRKNDVSGQMQGIASRLADADIAALAAYYAGQPVPAPRRAAPPAASVARRSAAGRGGPPASQAPQQGVGSEQGAPLTGGGQGPGGGGATTGVPPGQGAAPR